MEGQIPKIRTMARDLLGARGLKPLAQARSTQPAKQPDAKHIERTVPVQHPEQRRLSQILEEARGRMATQEGPRQTVVIPKTPEPRKMLEDILPIEPLAETPARGTGPTPLELRGKPSVAHGPPSNLPTGEPSIASPELAESPRPMLHDSIAGEEKPQRTPEEILGIQPKRAALPPSPPSTPSTPAAKPISLRPARKIPKFIFIAGFLGAILVILSYGIYWKVFLQKETPVPPAPPQKVTEQPLPESLVASHDTEIIEIKALEYAALKSKLDALQFIEPLPESLTYIPIKYSTQNQARYLTLAEIFKTLRIDAPPVLTDYKNYTLYLYSQGIEAEQLCRGAGILAKSCFGPRIGIVIELTRPDGGVPDKDLAANIMEEWEKTIVNDISPLMFAAPQRPEGYAPGVKFAVGEHGGFDTHYINLPIPTISVDWILADTHLVIATSKDAARSALDALK